MKYQVIENGDKVVFESGDKEKANEYLNSLTISSSLGYRQGNRNTYTIKEVKK